MLSQSVINVPIKIVEEKLSTLKNLYNVNYIYYLHMTYQGEENKSIRDIKFEDFYRSQSERSIKSMILSHMGISQQSRSNTGYVALSLSNPDEFDIRDFVSSDEQLSQYNDKIDIIDYQMYRSLTIRQEQIKGSVCNDKYSVLFFQFKSSEEWSHLEEYTGIIESLIKSDTNISKLVIILAHNYSFDKIEKHKFKFPSLHFHSVFTPLSIDILKEDKSELRDYYNYLDKSPLQLLSESGFIESKLKQSLKQVFLNDRPYHQSNKIVIDMIEFIDKRDLISKLFLHVIKNSGDSNNSFILENRDQFIKLNVNDRIVDRISSTESSVTNIVELMGKNVLPMILNLLQSTIKAIHYHCDFYYGLRLYKNFRDINEIDQCYQLSLWESIAMGTKLSMNDDTLSRDEEIHRDVDSERNPYIFCKNLFIGTKKAKKEWIPQETRLKVHTEYIAAIQNSEHPINNRDCGQILYNILTTENNLLTYLRNNLDLNPELWTQELENLQSDSFLQNLVMSMTVLSREQGNYSYNTLVRYGLPLRRSYELACGRPLLLSDRFIVHIVVLECFSCELSCFERLDCDSRLALLPVCQMHDVKLAELLANKNTDDLEMFARMILSDIKKDDETDLSVFIEFVNSTTAESDIVNLGKIEVLKVSLKEFYGKVFCKDGQLSGHLNELEEATYDVRELRKIADSETNSSSQSKLLRESWFNTIMELLSIVEENQKITNDETEDKIYFIIMIFDPIRALAQFIRSNVHFVIREEALILESDVVSLKETDNKQIEDRLSVVNKGIICSPRCTTIHSK